jgi:hypothetical protein
MVFFYKEKQKGDDNLFGKKSEGFCYYCCVLSFKRKELAQCLSFAGHGQIAK